MFHRDKMPWIVPEIWRCHFRSLGFSVCFYRQLPICVGVAFQVIALLHEIACNWNTPLCPCSCSALSVTSLMIFLGSPLCACVWLHTYQSCLKFELPALAKLVREHLTPKQKLKSYFLMTFLGQVSIGILHLQLYLFPWIKWRLQLLWQKGLV